MEETIEAFDEDVENATLELSQKEKSQFDRIPIGLVFDEEYFLGTGPGNTIILQHEGHPVEKKVEDPGGKYFLRRFEEQIIQADLDGSNRRVLYSHYNLYGNHYDVSPDGRYVVVVVDHWEVSQALVLIDVETGESRELTFHRSNYFRYPRFSPDGSKILYLQNRTRRRSSAYDIRIIDVQGGEPRILIEETRSQISQPRWTPDGSAVYLSLFDDTIDQWSIWRLPVDADSNLQAVLGDAARPPIQDPKYPLVDAEVYSSSRAEGDPVTQMILTALANSSHTGLLSASPLITLAVSTTPMDPTYEGSYIDAWISPDGTYLLIDEQVGRYERYLGRYFLDEGAYERLQPMRADNLEFSPDGEQIAVMTRRFPNPADERGGDAEIVVFPIDMSGLGEPSFVTVNNAHDSLGGWSRDGAYLFVDHDVPSIRRKTREDAQVVQRYHFKK